jgi:hypothetical protein
MTKNTNKEGMAQERLLKGVPDEEMAQFCDVWAKTADPMYSTNNVVPRAYIEQEVIVAAFKNGVVLETETKARFKLGDWAQAAHKKHGPCRVIAFKPGELMWREVRWKNANSGTLYRRPSFMTLNPAQVPQELQLAALMLG